MVLEPVQRWNGIATAPLGTGLTGLPTRLQSLPNGDLLVTGNLQGGATNMMRWNGATWSSWSPIAPAIDTTVRAIAATAAGGFVVVGPSLTNQFVWRRQGNAWTPIPGLPMGYYAPPTAVMELPNGNLLVGGLVPAGVLRWNGAAWTSIGCPVGNVRCLARTTNGDVLAAGTNSAGTVSVQRWDGTSWTQLGAAIPGAVLAIAVARNGEICIGGAFTAQGAWSANRVARWNGSAWTALGGGIGDGEVHALACTGNGTVVAGGTFTVAGGAAANRVARWNGVAWSDLGPTAGFGVTEVHAIAELPGGDLAIGGDFAFGAGGNNLARWNGSAWQPMGTGFWGAFGADVNALTVLPDGRLVVGGDFAVANGLGAARVVLVETTCPAIAVPSGIGCVGSGGANTLVATALPWAGGTFGARATGMPAFGLFAAVFGLASFSQPLSTVLPQGLAGCILLATPDWITWGVPQAGVAESTLAIPNSAALAGIVLHHQIVGIEAPPGSAIVAVSSTNSLVATVGVY
jgi:hypothetical protein